MIKLDYESLAIVISVVSTIAALVMFLIWRMDKTEKGLGTWAIASAVGAMGFFVIFFNPLLGDYATFLNNICTLSAPLLILEGIFQFRQYGRKPLRQKTIPILLGFFVFISYVNRGAIIRRYLIHDACVATLFALCAYFLIRGIPRKKRKHYMLTTGSFICITLGFIFRWYLTFSGKINPTIGLKHPFMGVLFFLIIMWSLGWTYGLILVINYRSQQRIMRMATEDELTGLANRKSLNQTLEGLLHETDNKGGRFLIFMVDLNGFKMINDTYGHALGDQVLVIMAKALKEVVKEQEYSARLGGDEFICIFNIEEGSSVNALKQKLRQSIEQPHTINDYVVELKSSIGYAMIPDDGMSLDEILDTADRRMYEEKTSHREMSTIIHIS